MKNMMKLLVLACTLVGVCVGCEQKSEIKQTTVVTAKPETTSSLSSDMHTTADITSETTQKTAKNSSYAKWEYNKETHCLTIRGEGETNNDEYTKEGEGEFWDDGKSISDILGDNQVKEVKEVVIEEGVTAVNSAAFAWFTGMEKITISDSVKKIGAEVFYNCESLKEIIIPDGVASIGDECFSGCRSLEKISFGKSTDHIGACSFAGCESLREISVSPENENLITKDGILYDENQKILHFAYANPQNVTIKKGTRKIGEYAFYKNPNLQIVTIPTSVITIEGGAFSHCKKLQKVIFAQNSNLKYIKDYCPEGDDYYSSYGCFMNCGKLTEMNFPESLKYMSDLCIRNCSSLKKVYLGENFEGYYFGKGEPAGKRLFRIYEMIGKKSVLEEIEVAGNNKNFTSEDGVLFDKNKEILYIYPSRKSGTKYMVPERVKNVAACAFYKSENLKSVVINGKDTRIDNEAFKDSKHVAIYGREGAVAQKFAKEHKMKFVAI